MDDEIIANRCMRKVHSSITFLVWHKEYLEQKVAEAKKKGYKESQSSVLQRMIDYYIENNEGE
jgi:hypothetical protein